MLNQNEKELLAVVKYFNGSKTAVAKLIKKLADEFEPDTVSHMTGFDSDEIPTWVALAPKRKARTKKVVASNIEAVAIQSVTPRFNTDLLAGSLANELHDEIRKAYHSGEEFLSLREVVEKFNCTKSSAVKAVALLKEDGVLTPGLPRRPLLVN